MLKKIRDKLSVLGPSLLWASAAIGVSHIVQSTRAGATYGYILIIAVLLANILKYPFFEFATRYTVVKNETVLDGYKKIGDWALYLYLILTILTMFTIQASVTIVTAAIFRNWLGLELSLFFSSFAILVACFLILRLNNRAFFNKLIKFLILLLIISTIVSAFVTQNIEVVESPNFISPDILSYAGLTFLIALIGWMPSPIDLSAWSSVWIMEKREENVDFSFKQNNFDFNFSYILTALLAVVFVILGANVFYGSGEEFVPSATVFVENLTELYASLGTWSRDLILITAFTAMFSTTITCLDAFPRVLNKCTKLLYPSFKKEDFTNTFLTLVIIGTMLTIFFLGQKMKRLVDIATILSFLTSPFLAYLNYRLIYSPNFPKKLQPHKLIRLLAKFGLFFLVVFFVIFILNIFRLIY
ncbi:divalent metal cation transporter [bacterium]|jgi:Mn2+/Fe2+ NRAMP family transporter|nr:divalent metal cation transporter [bacterium]MBT3850212.1 divalent metal cation transporter [bacterium]MBT4435658.1 divalent metal cation transporter [bacterium]